MIHSKKMCKNATCEECGTNLKPSQSARAKREGQSCAKSTNHLVCRNYPACPKAEKEANLQSGAESDN